MLDKANSNISGRIDKLLKNKRDFAMFSVLLITTALIFSYNLIKVDRNTDKTKEINLGEFTVVVPNDWAYVKEQGFDSEIGALVGEGIKLKLDFGWYSNSGINMENKDYSTFQELVDGRKATLYFPKGYGLGITGIYFDNIYNETQTQKTRLVVFGENLNAQQVQKAQAVFRSITFK